MYFYESHSTDPSYNLALEEYVFRNKLLDEPIFLLWQNENTIVIGSHQNTRAEINQEFVQENKIQVVRRITGGGAVYHDLGNVNFSFITANDGNAIDFSSFTKPVISALGKMGLEAELSGRNDIVADGRKISGNAQVKSQERTLHHGTLLYQSHLQTVQDALNVRVEKLKNKGVESVKSRVANIADLLSERGIDAPSTGEFIRLLGEMITLDENKKDLILSKSELLEIDALCDRKYRNDAWTFGRSPGYETENRVRYPFGSVEICLKTKKDRIEQIRIYGDFFGSADIEELENMLTGKHLNKDELIAALPENLESFISGMTSEMLAEQIVS